MRQAPRACPPPATLYVAPQNHCPSFLRRQTAVAESAPMACAEAGIHPPLSSPPESSPREAWLHHLMSGVTELPPVIPAEAGIHPPLSSPSPRRGQRLDLSLHTSYCSIYPDHQTNTVMTEWPLQDAKNNFSALVNTAVAGETQRVTRRGQPIVVVLSAEEYERLRRLEITNAPTLGELLLEIPQDDREFDRLSLSAQRPFDPCHPEAPRGI